jgi:chromosome segregation ATPase
MGLVTININADLSAMERQMSDLQAKFDELNATIEAEKAEVAEAVAALSAKVDELSAAVAAGEADKETVVAKLGEVNEGIKGIFSKPVEVPVEPPVE